MNLTESFPGSICDVKMQPPHDTAIPAWKESPQYQNKILSKGLAEIQASIFGNPATLVKHCPNNALRKKFEEIHLKLLEHNTTLVEYHSGSSSFPTDFIKKIYKFIKENAYWLISNTKDQSKIISPYHAEVLKHNLEMLQDSLERPFEKYLQKTCSLKLYIKHILSFDQFCKDSEANYFKHLPSVNPKSIQYSLALIRAKMHEEPQYNPTLLAEWINLNNVSLDLLDLNDDYQLNAIIPHLTHVTIGEMEAWDHKKYKAFLERCTKNQFLAIHTEEITELPNNLSQLTYLDCSGCENLKALPSNMDALETLKCKSCPALTISPELRARLVKIEE